MHHQFHIKCNSRRPNLLLRCAWWLVPVEVDSVKLGWCCCWCYRRSHCTGVRLSAAAAVALADHSPGQRHWQTPECLSFSSFASVYPPLSLSLYPHTQTGTRIRSKWILLLFLRRLFQCLWTSVVVLYHRRFHPDTDPVDHLVIWWEREVGGRRHVELVLNCINAVLW